MTIPLLLKLLGQTVLKDVQDSVLDEVAIQTGPEVVESVWRQWSRQTSAEARHGEILALARTPLVELEANLTGLIHDLSAGQRSQVRSSLSSYLLQVPGAVHRCFRRPSDPTGQTPPPGWNLRGPGDLQPLLPPRESPLTPGDRLGEIGDWEVVELIQINPLGELWSARQRRGEGSGALLQFCQHQAAREKLELSGAANRADRLEHLGRLKLPGVLQLRHLHLNARPPCLEYELFEGGDLASLVREWTAGPLPEATVVTQVVLQLTRVLGELHRQEPPLVHRGLRPAAVWLRQDGQRLELRLAELGLQELVPLTTIYASPEQQRGEPPQPRDDVYSLGLLWYQMLTGNLNANRPGGSQWRRKLMERGVTVEQIELLEACFEDEPEHRPADAAVLAERLEQLLERSHAEVSLEPVVANPAPAAVPRQRQRRADVKALFESLEARAPERPPLLTNSVGMKLALIPEGTFVMGAATTEKGTRENEFPQHEVTLTRPFYLAITPVTQAQYEQVMGSNPARFHSGNGGGPEHPVENVTWEAAVEFCQRLARLPAEEKAGRVYRLPTEAEWEYACRAGTTTPFAFGASLTAAQANFDGQYPYGTTEPGRSLQRTTPVGSYPANHFGLLDMHGNVWEWCADWLDALYYGRSPKRDPRGPEKGQYRVLRGGSWRNHAVTCRSAYRNGLNPRLKDGATGFRVVLEI